MTFPSNSFRLSPGFLRDLDRYALKKTRETGVKWTRTDALKYLVRFALEQQDVDEARDGLTGRHREQRASAIARARREP